MATEPEELIKAIEEAMLKLTRKNVTSKVLDLAEARAWLIYPGQPHGGQISS